MIREAGIGGVEMSCADTNRTPTPPLLYPALLLLELVVVLPVVGTVLGPALLLIPMVLVLLGAAAAPPPV